MQIEATVDGKTEMVEVTSAMLKKYRGGEKELLTPHQKVAINNLRVKHAHRVSKAFGKNITSAYVRLQAGKQSKRHAGMVFGSAAELDDDTVEFQKAWNTAKPKS